MQSAAFSTIGLFLKATNLPYIHNSTFNSNIRYDPFVVSCTC
jgi:hypothetical protein